MLISQGDFVNVSETSEQGNIKVTLTSFAVGPGILIYTASLVILSSGGFIFLNTSLRSCSSDLVHGLVLSFMPDHGQARLCTDV